ncbi:hypothetical protein BH10BAC4_BH10BAC4_10440 [soil metagenome]
MRLLTLGFITALFLTEASAQEAINVVTKSAISTTGRQTVVITYDLIASHSNIPCLIKAKFTSGDKIFFLRHITGDVGHFIYPGPGKQIAWQMQEELVHFSGDIAIDIEVSPHVTVEGKVKRTASLPVRFDDMFVKGKTYVIKLYRHEKEVIRLNDMMLLENSFRVEIPKKVKTGGDYQVFITDGEKNFYSNSFRVKPKVGLFWKVLPLLAVPIIIQTKKAINDNEALPGAPTFN